MLKARGATQPRCQALFGGGSELLWEYNKFVGSGLRYCAYRKMTAVCCLLLLDYFAQINDVGGDNDDFLMIQ